MLHKLLYLSHHIGYHGGKGGYNMFARRESFKEYLTYYPIVSVILIVHLVLYIAVTVPIFPNQYIFENMIGVNLYIVQGEWWRLLTPIFIHSGFSHLLFNSFSIFLFGPALERILGKVNFLFIYLFTGLIANMITLFIEPLTYSHLGSSGSIFGLFGYYIALIVFRKDIMSRNNSQVIATIIAISLIMTFIQPNINISAHIFGFLIGLLIGSFREAKGRNILSSYKNELTHLRSRMRSTNKPPTKTMIIWGVILLLALFGLFS